MFTRKFDNGFLIQLKNSSLFKDKLLPDIKNGDVFPAIRNERIDFYYKGGKLFSFSGDRKFTTNMKYAIVPSFEYKTNDSEEKSYVTEDDLRLRKSLFLIDDFSKNYEKIKTNCELYSQYSEALGVSFLYEYSFIKEEKNIVLLDTEISFENIKEHKKKDRIDILLYSRKGRELKFIEAKLYSNKELRAKKDKENKYPEIIDQIIRYNEQIKVRKDEILGAYNDYSVIMNELFDTKLDNPKGILPTTGLYIFGFDDDQKNTGLKRILENINNGINVIKEKKLDRIISYCKGDPLSIKINALWDGVCR